MIKRKEDCTPGCVPCPCSCHKRMAAIDDPEERRIAQADHQCMTCGGTGEVEAAVANEGDEFERLTTNEQMAHLGDMFEAYGGKRASLGLTSIMLHMLSVWSIFRQQLKSVAGGSFDMLWTELDALGGAAFAESEVYADFVAGNVGPVIADIRADVMERAPKEVREMAPKIEFAISRLQERFKDRDFTLEDIEQAAREEIARVMSDPLGMPDPEGAQDGASGSTPPD